MRVAMGGGDVTKEVSIMKRGLIGRKKARRRKVNCAWSARSQKRTAAARAEY